MMTMTDIDKALAVAKALESVLFGSWREMINEDPVAMIDVSPDGRASAKVIGPMSARTSALSFVSRSFAKS